MEDTTGLEKMLSEHFSQQVAEATSLTEMEQVARRSLQEVGRRALERWLEAEGAKAANRTVACECGAEAGYVRQRVAMLRTVLGEVSYRRADYVCPCCRKGQYPLDRRLGLRPNGMSGEVERLAGMMGVERPFEQGSRLLEEFLLLSLSDHSLAKAAQAYGEEQGKREEEWAHEAYDPDRVREHQRTVKPPRRLYGSMDGGRVHIRGETGVEDAVWRELKVGAWFTTYAQPPTQPGGQWSIRAKNIHYYTDICAAEDFGRLVWATGFQHHAQLAVELIILGDGAHWIWDLVAEQYPHAIQIVDWFHACQYLALVAQAVFFATEERVNWVEDRQTALWNGDLDAVIAACRALIDPNREDDPAHKAVTYFTNNRHRMDYPTYRANGYHIGSGTIESGIKQIGAQRMKAPGATWNLPAARKVAKARAAYLSHDWDVLAIRRTHLARAV